MNVKAFATLMAVYSVCFMCVALTAIASFLKGVLSPRGLALFLGFFCIAGTVVLTVAFPKLARKSVAKSLDVRRDEISDAMRKKRLRQMKIYKVYVFGLATSLVVGIAKGASFRPIPFFPLLLGIIMNLLASWGFVSAIRKLQRNLE